MTVLATAGHVDHGKSTFVNFITGQETDRLKEEKTRGLTINLGYTYFEFKNKIISIVDVGLILPVDVLMKSAPA